MQKNITTTIVILFILWIAVYLLHLPDMLIGFLLVGAVPGTSIALSPSMMLAIVVAIAMVFAFEIAARRVDSVKRIRQNVIASVARRSHS